MPIVIIVPPGAKFSDQNLKCCDLYWGHQSNKPLSKLVNSLVKAVSPIPIIYSLQNNCRTENQQHKKWFSKSLILSGPNVWQNFKKTAYHMIYTMDNRLRSREISIGPTFAKLLDWMSSKSNPYFEDCVYHVYNPRIIHVSFECKYMGSPVWLLCRCSHVSVIRMYTVPWIFQIICMYSIWWGI